MISRYTRQVMADLWSAEHRYQVWLRVETLAAEAMAKDGIIPAKAAKIIKEKARFSVQRIEEIEKTVKHDVIAFISNVSESIGDAAPYLHYGMTSSDVLDTSLGCLLKEASEILLGDLEELKTVLKDLAQRHKMTVMIGRTHGMHAEPTTFGLKCALWYAETDRNISRLREARKRIAVGKLSGAVGTYAHLPPSIEAYVCKELGLTPALVATQVIQRDRHAEFFSSLAVIGSTHEKIATEIRHLQRPEIGEAEEEFTAGQKGSSAMPHKRNPIASENITGLARLLRGYATMALENNALWHERDISHSSVERVIAPDATTVLDYQTSRLTSVLKGLVVYPEKMRSNLSLTGGRIFSQRVLLEFTKRGIPRDRAYELVQRNAMKDGSFEQNILSDEDVRKVFSESDIKWLFDVTTYLPELNTVYERVFKGEDNEHSERRTDLRRKSENPLFNE